MYLTINIYIHPVTQDTSSYHPSIFSFECDLLYSHNLGDRAPGFPILQLGARANAVDGAGSFRARVSHVRYMCHQEAH